MLDNRNDPALFPHDLAPYFCAGAPSDKKDDTKAEPKGKKERKKTEKTSAKTKKDLETYAVNIV